MEKRTTTILVIIALSTGIITSIIGYHALSQTPSLVDNRGRILLARNDPNIRRIAGVPVNQDLFVKIPEFLTLVREAAWLKMQHDVFRALEHRKTARLQYSEGTEQAYIKYPSHFEIFHQAGTIYLVALLMLVNATLVLYKHNTRQGFTLAIAIYSGALYILSAGILSIRDLVLPPHHLRWMISISYISSTTVLAFIYYAYIFPSDKLPNPAKQALLRSIYIFSALAFALYGTGAISYGFLMPASHVWVVIMIAGLAHSLVKEPDRFQRKQLIITLLVPSLTGLLFIFFNTLPNNLALQPLDFRHFAFFLLLTSFVLSTTLDHVAIHNRNKTVALAPEVTDRLTERQRQILEFLIQGHSAEKTASALNISYETVRTHLRNIYRALGVNSSLEAISLATGRLDRA